MILLFRFNTRIHSEFDEYTAVQKYSSKHVPRERTLSGRPYVQGELMKKTNDRGKKFSFPLLAKNSVGRGCVVPGSDAAKTSH